MKINLQKIIIGTIIVTSAMSAFAAPKFNNKKAISVLSREDGQKVITANKYIKIQNTKPYTKTKASGKVVVAGSSSVSPVMEKLIEAYKSVNQNAKIELQTSDSTTGAKWNDVK